MEIKNIGQLISHLASKAGIDATDKNLVNILSNAELTKIPIHSDLVKGLDENLLSIDVAGDNHPTLSAKYKSQALNPIDRHMQKIMEDFGLDEDTKTELLGIRSTYQRQEALSTKLKEMLDAKPAPGKGKDANSEALQKTIDDLQLKLKTANETITTKEADFAKKESGIKIDYALRNKLTGTKTIYDTLNADLRHSNLMTVINKELQDKDAELSYDDKGNLQILKKDGSKLYGANHTLITLEGLIDSTLAREKILTVAPAKTPAGPGQQKTAEQEIPGGGNPPAISGTNQSIIDFNRQQREAMAEGDDNSQA